jgi:hypothetical protein
VVHEIFFMHRKDGKEGSEANKKSEGHRPFDRCPSTLPAGVPARLVPRGPLDKQIQISSRVQQNAYKSTCRACNLSYNKVTIPHPIGVTPTTPCNLLTPPTILVSYLIAPWQYGAKTPHSSLMGADAGIRLTLPVLPSSLPRHVAHVRCISRFV